MAYDKLCQCNTHVTPNQAITFCQKALNIKEEPRLYCEMADANIADEMFDEGESLEAVYYPACCGINSP